MEQITWRPGRTFHVDDRVEIGAGSVNGAGTIGSIDDQPGNPKPLHVELDDDVEVGEQDRWPLKDGGYWDLCRDGGVAGGEILRVIEVNSTPMPGKSTQAHSSST